MNLYLLRHSNAEERPPAGKRGDFFRRLTPEGRDKARMIGQAIQRLELGLDLVLTSPAARAKETMHEVLSALKPRPPAEEIDGLWIGGDVGEVVTRLRQGRRPIRDVLLVGHEPDLSQLASRWLTGDSDLRMVFKKGGLCKLAVARLTIGRCATLEWHLTPRVLRLAAGSSGQ